MIRSVLSLTSPPKTRSSTALIPAAGAAVPSASGEPLYVPLLLLHLTTPPQFHFLACRRHPHPRAAALGLGTVMCRLLWRHQRCLLLRHLHHLLLRRRPSSQLLPRCLLMLLNHEYVSCSLEFISFSPILINCCGSNTD